MQSITIPAVIMQFVTKPAVIMQFVTKIGVIKQRLTEAPDCPVIHGAMWLSGQHQSAADHRGA